MFLDHKVGNDNTFYTKMFQQNTSAESDGEAKASTATKTVKERRKKGDQKKSASQISQ